MAFKAIPLETRSCKGCGVEFQTTDPRKWFHKSGCGYVRRIKWTNEWLLANRPNFPTEPCLACGAPVVQYRKRRYDGELRYCKRSCQPRPKAPLAKAKWPPIRVGECSRIPKGCRECGTGQRIGLCRDHRHQRYSLRQMIWTRLRWLLPRICNQCGQEFQRFESATLCSPCLRHNYAAQRKWGKIKRKHRMTGGSSKISPTRLYERDDRMCALCHRVTDHPRVWDECVNVCPGVNIGCGLNDGDFPRVNAEQHLCIGNPSPENRELVLLSHLSSSSGGAGVDSHHSFLADRQ